MADAAQSIEDTLVSQISEEMGAGQEEPQEEDRSWFIEEALEDDAVEAAEEDSEDSETEQIAKETERDRSEDSDEDENQGSRAQKRIRSLVSEKNELKRQAQEFRQQMDQLAQQNQYLAGQMQALMQGHQQPEKPQKSLEEMEPLERFEYEVLQKAQELVNPKLEALENQYKSLEQQREEARQKYEQKKHADKLLAQTKSLVDQHLLKDYDPDARQQLGEGLEDLVLTHAAAFGLQPVQSVAHVSKLLDKFAAAKLNSKAKASKVRKSQSAPKPVRASATAAPVPGEAGTTETPSLGSLKRNGFDSHFRWVLAGRPALKRK